MQVYKTAKGPAIFVFIFAPLIILLGILSLIVPFMQDNNLPLIFLLWPMGLFIIGFSTIGLLNTINGRIIVHDDRIQVIKTFSDRELYFDEIKGFKVTINNIIIESATSDKKSLKFYSSIKNLSELVDLLTRYYPNLDDLKIEADTQQILSNEQYGHTLEARAAKFRSAQKKAKILNWTGGLAGVWTFFYPIPYEFAILTSIAIPVLTLINLKFSSGLFRIDENNESVHPSLSWAIFAPSFALGLRALLDFKIYDFNNAGLFTSILAVALLNIIFLRNREFNFKKAKDYLAASSILIAVVCYSYGAIITLNCYYDKSDSKIYKATIVNKRISTGKNISYYLELTKWGTQDKNEEVSVKQEFYNQFENGDQVTIYFQNGWFNIPWFFVSD